VLGLRPREHGQHLCDAAGAAQRPVALRDDLEVIADRAQIHAGSGEKRHRQVGGQVQREGQVEGPLRIRALVGPQSVVVAREGGVG
jgi:hypothetical protein